ncbi:hypothetical protein [Streptomyces aidingensis]|uniref:Uncharacterized protein n=1 Tax=Streptomyces aidingensis TaxID=910347 RepID=A0A1I1M9U8_9ACTN|nr:hypothetical protein [Streptomyces aidingensis]SFC78420.1 hypothetical protein SAMN05421773_10628 [Streptomyces aidingensis]
MPKNSEPDDATDEDREAFGDALALGALAELRSGAEASGNAAALKAADEAMNNIAGRH